MSAVTRVQHAAAIAVLLCAWLPAAQAQDSFGGSTNQPPQRQQPKSQQPRSQQQLPLQQPMPSQPRSSAPVSRLPEMSMSSALASREAQDFGVAPTGRLRPSQQLHGPTPTSIPGGKVIATRQLSEMLQRGQGNVLVLHAYGAPEHLPGAQQAGPASQGGSFDDQVQREFGQYLRQASGGDTSRMLVIYCAGPQCWGSYNAALRAIHMGFRNVYWYRGGLEAWGQAGLPLQDAQGQPVRTSANVQQGMPPQREQW